MSLFLAVDAGGTKTDFLLADDTRELARVRCGTIKRMRTDAESAAANLDTALLQLARQSGVSMGKVRRTCIGTAGETVPLVTEWLTAAFSARVAGELLLLGDVEIALDAAFPGQPGVLVLAGTGSNVAGRSRDGILTSAGGWGPALADQGSGHRIGLEALRALFFAIDASRTTALREAILECWQLTSIDQLVEYANRLPAPDFSCLTYQVVRCATSGDEVAAEVLRREGEDLGQLVKFVLRRLRSGAHASESVPPVAFAGSIMEKVTLVRQAVIDSVRLELPHIETIDGVVAPLTGALWRARRGV